MANGNYLPFIICHLPFLNERRRLLQRHLREVLGDIPLPQPLLLLVEEHARRELEALERPAEVALAVAFGEILRVDARRQVLRAEALAVVVGQDRVEAEREADLAGRGRAVLLEGRPRDPRLVDGARAVVLAL